jgi:hypothetical protein
MTPPAPDTLNAERSNYRQRAAIALATWAFLPISLAITAGLRREIVAAIALAFVAGVGLTACGLTISSEARYHRLAVLLLLLLATPFALRFLQRLTFVKSEQVADAPAGFIVGAVFDLLMFVPLISLARGIWRRSG